MTINKKIWKECYTEQELTAMPCPNCKSHSLDKNSNSIKVVEAIESKKDQMKHPEYSNPFDYYGYFVATFKCHNCDETVTMSGKTRCDYCETATINNQEIEYKYYPMYIIPAPEMFEIPVKVPYKVRNEVLKAFQLFWADYSAAGNRIRIAIERLLDAYKIPQFPRKGKRRKINLHNRINKFGIKHPNSAKKLLAIKWIANEASHEANLKCKEIIFAMDVLDFVFDELYEGNIYTLHKKVSEIIKKHE